MERTESRILGISIALMAAFFAGLVYAYRAYGVRIPSCVTEVKPFEQGKVIQRGEKDFEVHLLARMWAFEPAEVALPPGAHATIYLSSGDVTHGMHIVGTNVNLMAVPGAVNVAEVTFERPGEYRVVCHEFCGRGHQMMAGKFVIREGAVVAAQPASAVAGAVPGQALFEKYECLTCHSLDGSDSVGPTFKGLFGRTETEADGTQLKVDEAHLAESIREPAKKVTNGFDPMPEVTVPEEDLRAMVEAIKQLSP
jgi:cytochrome c oxidase subunit II